LEIVKMRRRKPMEYKMASHQLTINMAPIQNTAPNKEVCQLDANSERR
jgi:hypothetical protein